MNKVAIKVKLYSRTHLYDVIKRINETVGHEGKKVWPNVMHCNDRPLRLLKASNGQPVEVVFHVDVNYIHKFEGATKLTRFV
jgi:hypothetical protein